MSEHGENWRALQTILSEMNVPPTRVQRLAVGDLVWLASNLCPMNMGHPGLTDAVGYLRKLRPGIFIENSPYRGLEVAVT